MKSDKSVRLIVGVGVALAAVIALVGLGTRPDVVPTDAANSSARANSGTNVRPLSGFWRGWHHGRHPRAKPTPSPSPSTASPSPMPTTSTPTTMPTQPGGGGGGGGTGDPGRNVPGWKLTWDDEFDGSSLDTSRWEAKNNTYAGYDLPCITNRPNNVFVADGTLTIRAQREDYACGSRKSQYTTGYVDSTGKASWTFGRFEMRAKMPTTPSSSTGLWPAFWLRPDDGGSGEIDIVEQPGGANLYNASTQGIFQNYTPVVKQDHRAFPAGKGYPASGWHTYTTEWEKGAIRWYIDGVEVWSRDTSTTPWMTASLSRPFNIRLNFQVGGWLGNPDANTHFPADFTLDYVRVWQR